MTYRRWQHLKTIRFQLLGNRGICWRDATAHPPTLSERHGHRTYIRFWRWILTPLGPCDRVSR